MKRILIFVLILLMMCSPAMASQMQLNVREDLAQMGIEIEDALFEEVCREYGGGLSVFSGLIPGYGGRSEFAYNLLMYVGMGSYDYETWTRTPLSDDVFAMDAEVYDMDCMYTDFIAGIQPLVPGATFTEVAEDMSDMLDEDGWPMFSGGTRKVSFKCNGNYYEAALENYGDWLNPEIITFINDVLVKEGCNGKLHVVTDDYDQMMLIIYGSDEEAAALREYIAE